MTTMTMNLHIQRLYSARSSFLRIQKRNVTDSSRPLIDPTTLWSPRDGQPSPSRPPPPPPPQPLQKKIKKPASKTVHKQKIDRAPKRIVTEEEHAYQLSLLQKKFTISEIHPFLNGVYSIDGIIPHNFFGPRPQEVIPSWDRTHLPLKTVNRQPARYEHIWLRDNCRCSKCVNQDTMQRAFDTFSHTRYPLPREVKTEKAGLRITWQNDDHVSLYPWDWLMKHQPLQIDTPPYSTLNEASPVYKYWGADIKDNPPSVHYDEIMSSDEGVAKWTDKIRKYGFSYVDGCPVTPEATQRLLERISFIRQTHYGGFYDFTSDLTMKDTAYTTLALPAHTDTTYFTEPAGLQMFHLLSHTDGEGGKSLLVDGFNAAQKLKEKLAYSYEVLAGFNVPCHASGNDGVTIQPSKRFPVLNMGEIEDNEGQQLLQVRWNNDDRGIIPLVQPNQSPNEKTYSAKEWYFAANMWNNILKQDDMEYWAQLIPGRPLIFDNWRVLHGRSAFTGKRRICGGYINHDDFISRWRNTNYSREQVISQIL